MVYVDLDFCDMQKVGDLCLRPWQQGIPSSGLQATIVMATLKPTLEIMKAIQSYLIQARGTEVINNKSTDLSFM